MWTRNVFFAAMVVAVAFASDSAECVDGAQNTPTTSYRLSYFDGRGLAELIRTVFALAGKLPGSGYEDVRVSRDEFPSMKADGSLKANMDRLPILEYSGAKGTGVIGQSGPIARFVAREHGLMGNDELQAAYIESICEHTSDIKSAWGKLVPHGAKLSDEEKKEARDIWFNTPESPALDGRKERQLHWFLTRVERVVGSDGYAVGSRFSLADACVYSVLGEHEPSLGEQGQPFGDKATTDAVLAKFPKLDKLISTFRESPGIKAWLSSRSTPLF